MYETVAKAHSGGLGPFSLLWEPCSLLHINTSAQPAGWIPPWAFELNVRQFHLKTVSSHVSSHFPAMFLSLNHLLQYRNFLKIRSVCLKWNAVICCNIGVTEGRRVKCSQAGTEQQFVLCSLLHVDAKEIDFQEIAHRTVVTRG